MKVLKKILINIVSVPLLFIIILTNTIYAQQDGDAISLGDYKIIRSKILNENRKLLVHLPRDYAKNNRNYPVFYMLYGNQMTTYFAEVVSVLDRLGPTGRIPEMILIGLENTDRYRDLLPQRSDGSASGIDNFIAFFKQELIPWVENNYRCKNFRMILGPQAGANFVFYTLFKNPEIFNAGIINNPFRWTGGRDLNIKKAKETLRKNKTFKKTLFITHDDTDQLEREGNKFVDEFYQFLQSNKPEGFNLYLNFKKGWDEFISFLGTRKALKTIFKNYPISDESKIKNLGDLKDHFNKLSQQYGYSVYISEHVLVTHYDRLNRSGKNHEAEEILNFLLKQNPKSSNGLWRQAQIYIGKGELQKAIARLEEMQKYLGSDSGMVTDMIKRYKRMITDSAAYALQRAIIDSGLKAAEEKYQAIKGGEMLYFDQREFNALGYQLMGQGKMAEAIFILNINVSKFPKSPNVYDSLGEAYFFTKDYQKAKENYQKVLKIDPQNKNATAMIKKINKILGD